MSRWSKRSVSYTHFTLETNTIQESCKDRANVDIPHYCMQSLHLSTRVIPQKTKIVRFDILTEMPMNITTLWKVTSFILGNVYRHFEKTCGMQFQDIKSTMNIETARSFKKQARIYEITCF
jgi:hypothetical protein